MVDPASAGADDERERAPQQDDGQRAIHLLTTCWSESTLSFAGPASRHGSSIFFSDSLISRCRSSTERDLYRQLTGPNPLYHRNVLEDRLRAMGV
jgi:hypothetical protein